MKIWLALSLVCALLISGCSNSGRDNNSKRDNNYRNSNNSITELREYDLNDGLHVVVGVGRWNVDKTLFSINSYDGEVWDVGPSVIIEEKPVTLESFKKVTK